MADVAVRGAPAEPGGPPTAGESIFDRYGIPRPLGVWSAASGAQLPRFGYVLAWDSLTQRDATFPRFGADPLWKAIRANRHGDDGVPMVERIDTWLMVASPAWKAVRKEGPDGPVGGLHELRIYRPYAGYVPEATQALAELILPQMQLMGGLVLGVFNVVIGPRMAAIVSFTAWPNYTAQQRAVRRLDIDSRITDFQRDFALKNGRPLFRDIEHSLLYPVDYGLPLANFGIAA